MNKKFEKIYEIAEREGWQVDYSYNDEKEKEFFYRFIRILLLDKTSIFKYMYQMKKTKTLFTKMWRMQSSRIGKTSMYAKKHTSGLTIRVTE